MADSPTPQNFQNHTRYDPKFHFVLLPILAIHFLYRIYELVRHLLDPAAGRDTTRLIGATIIAFALLLMGFIVRLYAVKVQTRVIRLEERLRLEKILPAEMRSRIPELTESQLVALRFAPNEELTELTRAALDKKLGNKEIKQGIRNWRADNFRV